MKYLFTPNFQKLFIPVHILAALLPYTAGICTEQEFGSRKLGKGLPATPTAGGAALQGNLQTQTTRLWSILKWGTTEYYTSATGEFA